MSTQVETPVVKRASVWELLRRVGPGIVAALALYASGDITLMCTMGARWGYHGLWLTVVALCGLFGFYTVTARYHLATGESISWALARTAGGRWITWYVAIGCLMATHMYNSYIIQGMGISWNFLVPGIPAKAWSVIWVVVGLVLVGKGLYPRIEMLLKLCLFALSVTVLYLFFAVRPSVVGLLSSMVPGPLPGGTLQDTFALALSVMGATTTSVIIIGYAYLIGEKGWTSLEHGRQMVMDSFVSCALAFAFNAMLYAVAVETLRPRGITVKNVYELAEVLGANLGTAGYYLFYIALFAAVFSSWVGFGYMAALVARDAISPVVGKGVPAGDRWFMFFMYLSMVLPLVWTFTKFGFVQLMLFVTAILNYFFIVPLALVMVLSNGKRFARDPQLFPLYRATWWENVFLGVTLACVVYFCAQTLIGLFR